MQRQRQPKLSRTLDSVESPVRHTSSVYCTAKPSSTTSIKQLIQIEQFNRMPLQNNNRNNYLIKYPVSNQHSSSSKTFQHVNTKCDCQNENEYDEINSFTEHDHHFDTENFYDHLHNDNTSNHYLQPAYQVCKPTTNYYLLNRKHSTKSSQPPPLPRSKLPPISSAHIYQTNSRSAHDLLNKSFASSGSSDKFAYSESFNSPISSGYNSCQDIHNQSIRPYGDIKTADLENDYYFCYENNQTSSVPTNCQDSGVSTLNLSSKLSDDEYTNSNLSPYYSSPSASSFSSLNRGDDLDSVSMVQASPFPRVNTSFVAQIKQINPKTPKQTKIAEPIYENLKHPLQSTNKSVKQYSLNDIFNSLKSLDLNTNSKRNREHRQKQHLFSPINQIDYSDKLCDQEVEFYLSPSQTNQHSSNNEYQQINIKNFNNTTPGITVKANAFWEQLV